ncbi:MULTISPECIES: iron-containing alcohol dehydrogenase [unclassified Bradyrhizobium]|uniref:iron-containing alcohol dehydrogenase n=1 Tax=unclassified Bradyrhizobium TaxID=2631580 RepID=UPI0028EA0372|nr:MULTISPECIES: iron-containing alcohol dehydrogenase [unclassified Bradyrhizobium]
MITGLQMVASLQLPRTVFGAGALSCLDEELDCLGMRRPMLVTDHGITTVGLVDRVNAALKRGPAAAILNDVTENPLFSDADRGAALYRANHCDGVIALGGGSVIDTAKYIALLATNPGSVSTYAGNPTARPRRCAPLAVLPTTAGTGSEASPDAGIHPDAATASTGMSSPAIVPHLAMLDPELSLTLPPRLTAATGIDAISHCVEGYLSSRMLPFADALALDGIRRAMAAIRDATERGGDLRSRSEMMAAAYAGGVAISMGLGPAHAIAITCGDQGFHHGLLSGTGLVCSLDSVSRHASDRAAAIAAAMGLPPGASLSAAIAVLMRTLNLPATLAELGYRGGDVSALGSRAHASPFNQTARYHPSAAEYTEMIQRSLDGMIGATAA